MISSTPTYFPKAPFPSTITLGLGLQHMYVGGTQIQSTTAIKPASYR